MKKYLLIAASILTLLAISFNADAQKRTKLSNGVYLVTYGNTAVIEDDNNQRSISIEVQKREDNSGRVVYDIFCGNKYTKGIIKTALQGAISSILIKAGSAISGESGAVLARTISDYANSIASNFYDDVCAYYGDR